MLKQGAILSAVVCSIFPIVLRVIYGQNSFLWGWWCLAGLLICFVRYGDRLEHKFILYLIMLGCTFFLVIEGQVVLGSKGTGYITKDPDTIIVLGAGLHDNKATKMLMSRVEKAVEVSQTYPNSQIIVSGGYGKAQTVSEAQVMYEILVQHGIETSRIHLEEQSHNTIENLTYSKELLVNDLDESYVVIVSSGFHLYRAGLIASKLGYKYYATIPADVAWPLHIHYTYREFFSIVKVLFVLR